MSGRLSATRLAEFDKCDRCTRASECARHALALDSLHKHTVRIRNAVCSACVFNVCIMLV